MNQYVTGAMIRRLREQRRLTQLQLAERICVSDKAVSKWETGRGYPDITLIEPLAEALGVSVIELFSGEDVVNTNRASHMLRAKLYVCPVCGNVIFSAGEAVVSCCGLTLPLLEAVRENNADEKPRLEFLAPLDPMLWDRKLIEAVWDYSYSWEIYTPAAKRKSGYYDLRKLYPEGAAAARFKIGTTERIYFYCNRHGLFSAAPGK